jgi:putative intracellular protease/amidase
LRLFTSQLVVNGSASQGDIRRAFGVPKIAVQRAVDRYRAGGAAAFFVPPQPRAGRKLTPEVLPQVQALLDQGQPVPQISRTPGVLASTIHQAIRFGRLRAGAKKRPALRPPALHAKPAARRSSNRPAGLRHHAHGRALAGRGGRVAAGAGAV